MNNGRKIEKNRRENKKQEMIKKKKKSNRGRVKIEV